MGKPEDTYTKIAQTLYRSREEASSLLTARELEIRTRMQLCVARRMDNPMLEDAELVQFLMHGCGGQATPVGQSQAYRDIGMVNRLTGNIQLASKQWYRYLIVEGAKKAYDLAMEKGDAKGAAAALDKIGKYTRCDKEDDRLDFEKMIPPSFEPSDDITLIEGLEPIDNLEERRRELRQLARGMVLEKPEDAEVVENEATDDTDDTDFHR